VRSTPVIHDRSWCATLHCFESIDVVGCLRTPDCRGILKLRSHERGIGCCLDFPRTTSGVTMDEGSGGVTFLTDITDVFVVVQLGVDSYDSV